MIDIKINITNKIANAIGTPFIVCGNSDYTVTFTFDAEWGAYQEKTARFFFVSDGIEQYIDVLFSGNTCNAPVLPNIEKVLIGVYTGNLRTTTGAEVRCKRSILFGGKVHEPPTNEDVYNEILEIVGKKLGSEGGTVTGDYFKDGNTFIHEGNLDLLDETDNLAITKTATGSAITIESAKAPLQQLKLYGHTEKKEVCNNVMPYPYDIGTVTLQGVTFTNNGDGSIKIKGTATASSSTEFLANASVNLTVGKTYKIQGIQVEGSSTLSTLKIQYANDYGGYDEGIGNEGDKFTAIKSSNTITLTIAIDKGVTYDCTIHPQLITETATLDSLGDSGSFEVGVYEKNLLEVAATTQTKNGVTFTVNADKSINVKGTATSELTYHLCSPLKIKLPIGKYKMLGKFWVRIYKGDTTITTLNCAGISSTIFEITESGLELVPHYWCENGKTIDTTIYPMILLADETDTTFEKGNKQSLTLTDTLRGVGEVADEIDFARGVKIQRCASVDLGTLTWGKDYEDGIIGSKSLEGIVQPTKNTWDLPNALCSAYGIDSADNVWNSVNDKRISISQGGYIRIRDNSITDYTTLGAQMSGKYLVYPLATPIETPLTETELNAYRQLMTNKGTTTVLSECEDTEITYYINKPNAQAIGNIHSQVNKDYFKLQQAIIETGGN